LLARYPQFDKILKQASWQKAPPKAPSGFWRLDHPVEVGYNCYRSGVQFHLQLPSSKKLFVGGTGNLSQVSHFTKFTLVVVWAGVDRCFKLSLRFQRSGVTRYF
jgi:hypothetical protein